MKLKLNINLPKPSKTTLTLPRGENHRRERCSEQQRKDLELEDWGWWLEGQECGWRGQARLSVSEGLRASFISKVIELLPEREQT